MCKAKKEGELGVNDLRLVKQHSGETLVRQGTCEMGLVILWEVGAIILGECLNYEAMFLFLEILQIKRLISFICLVYGLKIRF